MFLCVFSWRREPQKHGNTTFSSQCTCVSIHRLTINLLVNMFLWSVRNLCFCFPKTKNLERTQEKIKLVGEVLTDLWIFCENGISVFFTRPSRQTPCTLELLLFHTIKLRKKATVMSIAKVILEELFRRKPVSFVSVLKALKDIFVWCLQMTISIPRGLGFQSNF